MLEDYKTVPEDLLNQYGYQIYKNVAGYNLYYCADVEQRDLGGWIVTQYTERWFQYVLYDRG